MTVRVLKKEEPIPASVRSARRRVPSCDVYVPRREVLRNDIHSNLARRRGHKSSFDLLLRKAAMLVILSLCAYIVIGMVGFMLMESTRAQLVRLQSRMESAVARNQALHASLGEKTAAIRVSRWAIANDMVLASEIVPLPARTTVSEDTEPPLTPYASLGGRHASSRRPH